MDSARRKNDIETEYRVLGTKPLRHDGIDKVTGGARYGADIQLPRLLHGKILRSPYAHAIIKSIDVSKAMRSSGVLAVVTSQDFPSDETIDGIKYLRNNVLASDRVLYKGHPVAGIVAASQHDAEEALGLIEVEYEPLKPVVSVLEAMELESVLLHDDIGNGPFSFESQNPSNIANHYSHSMGNIEEGFRDADLVVEREFKTETVHQGYIEPHNTTALWGNDGKLTIWCSTQGPFEVRDATAQILGINVSDIKVIPMEIGGGFGGKFEPYGDPVAALLSKKTGRPVKIVMSRSEDLESTGPTSGSYLKLKLGAKKDGNIVAAKAYLAYEAGAYPGSPVDAAAMCIFAAYDIPNILIDGFDVVVNKPKTAAYRAPGATNAAFACETLIDELAIGLSMDPLALRLFNAAKQGSRRPDGLIYPKIGCVETIEAMMKYNKANPILKEVNVGRGFALGYWMNDGGPSACTIIVNSDGTVNLNEGSPDIGGTRSSIAMQAAEVLGLLPEDVHPVVMDTDSIGYTSGTGGSSVTFKTGMAAYYAAQDVKRQMTEFVAYIWGLATESILYSGGLFKSTADDNLSMTFQDVAKKMASAQIYVVGSSAIEGNGAGGAFAGCIVDVKVDEDTGKVDVIKIAMLQDVGKAIHPSYVEGQMQGGAAQGIGWALNEEYKMDSLGVMTNASFLDYRMPTSLDLPMIDTVIIEVPNPNHPFGVRGVGEVSIVPPPPAVANAIHNALGVRLNRLPMNPSSVLEAIWNHVG